MFNMFMLVISAFLCVQIILTHAGFANSLLSEWRLFSLNNMETVRDIDISLKIEMDQMSGFSSCNTYVAPYEKTGDTIKVGSIQSTRKFCGQSLYLIEQDYFHALKETKIIKQVGDDLIFYDNRNKKRLLFQLKRSEGFKDS